MTTGTFSLGNCYINAQDATDAYFHNQQLSVTYNPTNATFYQSTYERDAAGLWYLKQYSLTGTATKIQTFKAQVFPPVFNTCDTSNYPLSGMINLPTSTDANAAWAAGFVLPMTLAFVAWGAAKLLSTFNERK